jgi:6-pyruvoyltetrahydropterin/6-carboxytetrahydropterin synthase
MSIRITRVLEFDAAHRVMNHESKCANLHGHRYKVEIEAQAVELDSLGRVIDFSVIKQKIGGWIDENWDHTCILFADDAVAFNALMSINRNRIPFLAAWNPTAENMANYLLTSICPKLLDTDDIKVTKVTLWETPNCFAEASL